MNYHNITHDDMLNGEGLRTVLWVSGCMHECPGCQNPETWDVNSGIEFDSAAMSELMGYLDKDYCAGLTITGGDPLLFYNISKVRQIMQAVRLKYGYSKSIWIYTGYEFLKIMRGCMEPYYFEELTGTEESGLTYIDIMNDILAWVDVLVTGPYIEAQRSPDRLWVGSDNQEIWRVMRGPDIYGWKRDEKQYQEVMNK